MSSARERLEKEAIDYRFIGLKPIRSGGRDESIDPMEVIERRVGISMSTRLLERLDALAKKTYPGEKYIRSRFVRDILEVGLRGQIGQDWESVADEILQQAHQEG